jgi:hypothetical protein
VARPTHTATQFTRPARQRIVLCVVAAMLWAVLGVAPARAYHTFDNPFGVVEGFLLPQDVCALGAGWDRIIFDWAQHQPEKADDWHTLNIDDRWLKEASACGREVVAIFKHTPAWATDGTPGPGLPRGLYLPVDDPNNLWANFVRRSAEYYAPRGVKHFIIWNEPDIERGTFGFEFEGTLDDYFQMLKVAYLAAKQGNPAAVIHVAGTTYWHDVNNNRRLYLDRLIERIQQDPDAAAHDYYFDVISLHIYFRTETVYQIVSEYRALLERYNLADKRIWINETNASPTDDPQWPVERETFSRIDLDQQAAFLVQAAALGLSAGAERIAVYKFYDWNLPSGDEAWGLVRADGTHRPAYAAWRTVIERLQDVQSGFMAQSDKADVVSLLHGDYQTLLAWTRTDVATDLTVTATSDKAYLIDQYGNTQIVRPVDGVYTLSLPAARCNEAPPVRCPIGGNVWLLVQPLGEFTVTENNRILTFEGVNAQNSD